MKIKDIIVESEQLDEGIYQVAQEIVDQINTKFTQIVGFSPMSKRIGRDVPWAPFHVRQTRSRSTRFDGQRFENPSYIHVPSDSWQHLKKESPKQIMKHFKGTIPMMDMAWDFVKSLPGAKPMGQVAGWAGSDEYKDAVFYKGTIFWRSGTQAIAFATKKRFQNKDVWRTKKEGVDEDENPCWDGYKRKPGTKKYAKGSCVKEETYEGDEFYEAYGDIEETLEEAEYQGRKVELNKPMQGDVKKFKVYVKDPSTGNVKKVNFGDPNMKIRKSDPGARKSFRARHNCDNPGPKTKARYWSCRKW